MKEFWRNAGLVTALRWDGDVPTAKQARRLDARVTETLDKKLLVVTPRGVSAAEVGEWLVKSEAGEVEVVDHARFLRDYSPRTPHAAREPRTNFLAAEREAAEIAADLDVRVQSLDQARAEGRWSDLEAFALEVFALSRRMKGVQLDVKNMREGRLP